MAKMIINGSGKDFELDLAKLGNKDISARVVQAGAEIVADEIWRTLSQLPPDKFRKLKSDEVFIGVPKKQKDDLLESLGITPVKIDYNGKTNIKIGFDGYGSYPTHKYKKGIPNALLARAIESGSSVRVKTPFVRVATNKSRVAAIKAMQEKFIEETKNIMK